MLTESQQNAIESEARDILCIAGAGSGKTFTMTERISRLLDAGVAAKSMLVLTFTRRAARQMRERIEAKQGAGATRDMLCNTFHSVCLSILRAYGDRIGYDTQTLSVIDTIDADALLQSTARDMGLATATGRSKSGGPSLKSLAAYRDAIYAGQPVEPDPKLAAWFMHYTSERRAMNVLDFGSCLTEVNRLFTECPDVLETYRRRIGWVFVDEFQDTDETQFILHDWFKDSAFFAVGDRRQSIYKWRGSRPELMTEKHPNATIIDLRECFRCGDSIVQAANRLIAVNGDTLAQPMIAAAGGGVVETITGRTDTVVEKIAWLLQAYTPRDIAVIARRHDHLKRIAGRLADVGIAHHRVGATSDIADDPAFRAMFAAIRLIANPRDNMAFMALRELFGVTATDYAHVRSYAASKGLAHCAAFMEIKGLTGITDKPNDNLGSLLPRIARSQATSQSIVDWWNEHCAHMSCAEAVEWFGARDIHAENEEAQRDEAVTLLTAHAAKGLEFKVVIVAEMNEGSMPSSQGIRGGEDAIAEERRVGYVAMTRAKERLILHYRQPEHFDDPKYVKPPSRFLIESGVLAAESVAV